MADKITIYHKNGTELSCYPPTAAENCREWPDTWRMKPWPQETAAPPGDAGNAGAETGTAAAPPAPPAPSAAKVEVPENWEALPFFALQDLAQKIVGKQDPTIKKADALKIIKDYLATR